MPLRQWWSDLVRGYRRPNLGQQLSRTYHSHRNLQTRHLQQVRCTWLRQFDRLHQQPHQG